MPSILEIKNRISAIKTTEKITKVMQMVSMSKISYVKNATLEKEIHLNNLESKLNNYFKYGNISHKYRKYFENSNIKIKNKAYIFLSSDSGMSGSISSSVFKSLASNVIIDPIIFSHDIAMCGGLNNYVINELKKKISDSDIIIPIGKKANMYINKNYKTNKYIHKNSSSSKIIEIEKNNHKIYNNKYYYVEDIFDRYLNEEIDSINIIYAKFVNNIKFDLVNEQIFPIKLKECKEDNINSISLIKNDINIEALLKHFLYCKINHTYSSHYQSILSARINATTSSINNAKDLINELSIQYNKIRQNKITNQLLDLVSSSI